MREMKKHNSGRSSTKSRWDSRLDSREPNRGAGSNNNRGFSKNSNHDVRQNNGNRDVELGGSINERQVPPAPTAPPAAVPNFNGNPGYFPYPYFFHPNMYMQGPPPAMWPNMYPPPFNPFQPPPGFRNPQQTGGCSSRPSLLGNYPFTPPPPQKQQSEIESSSADKKEADAEEPPRPGSEAAREKERAEIAKRLLQDSGKNPAATGDDKEKTTVPKTAVKSTSLSKPSAKKPAPVKAKPTLKRPATSSSSEAPKKKKNAKLSEDIAKRISAMGVNEIKSLVNNPHTFKSQEILKALMDHYRELKGVELDKRRMLAPTTVDSTPSFESSPDSIGISDLPPEIISQLEKVLGCNIFAPGGQPQPDDDVCILSPPANNPQAECDNQETANTQMLDPVKILEELVFIDMRIQSDICRKMELYQSLHEIVSGGKIVTAETADSTSSPRVPRIGSPGPSNLSQPREPEEEAITIPSTCIPLAESQRGGGSEKSQSSMQKKGSNPVPAKKSVHSSKASKPSLPRSSRPPLVLKNTVSFDVKSLNVEIHDMKVADSSVVLIACSNKMIYGFDLKTAKKTHEFKGHVDVVTCLKPVKYFRGSIEEHLIFSGGLDEHLCVFGFKSQLCVSKNYVASPIMCLEYFHDPVNNTHTMYAGSKNGSIHMHDVEKFSPKGTLDCGDRAILALLATKEDSLNVLLVASEDKTICLRDANTGLYLRQFSYSYIATNFVLYEDAVFCQSITNGITYFNMKTGKYMGFLRANCSVSRIAQYDNLLLVTLCSGAIKVFDMDTKTHVTDISGGGKLLRYIDVADANIVTAARMNAMLAMPFTPDMKAVLAV